MLPARGAADYSQSAHPKWRVLAIVTVYYPVKATPVIGMQRTGYVHVTGIPMPAGWAVLTANEIQARLARRLTKRYAADDDPRTPELEKRLWCGDATLIAAGARNTLRTERQITVTWAQFKNAMRRRDTNAAMTDDEVGD